MKKIFRFDTALFYEDENKEEDLCFGKAYYDLLDYAFNISDFFMLVYIDWYAKGYTEKQKEYMQALKQFSIKEKDMRYPSNSSLYKYVYYKKDEKAKEILKKVNSINDWCRPDYPEDLSFFKGNTCRIKTIIHEGFGYVLHATDEDILFFTKLGLTKPENVKFDENNFYDRYDEELI